MLKQLPSWPLLKISWSVFDCSLASAQGFLLEKGCETRALVRAQLPLYSPNHIKDLEVLLLLATNDRLSQNGIANFASSANNFEWSWSESYNSSTDRIWQELIIISVFPLSVNLEVCPTRLSYSSCWVLIWQLWFGCCAISMLVTSCSMTLF